MKKIQILDRKPVWSRFSFFCYVRDSGMVLYWEISRSCHVSGNFGFPLSVPVLYDCDNMTRSIRTTITQIQVHSENSCDTDDGDEPMQGGWLNFLNVSE